jgi:hypothetical protein
VWDNGEVLSRNHSGRAFHWAEAGKEAGKGPIARDMAMPGAWEGGGHEGKGMKASVGDLRELVGPMVRFTLTLTDDDGDPLMSYPGWTLNVYRDVQAPATKTSRGFYKRFTETSPAFERQLLEALEGFSEVEKVLGPKQERVRSRTRKIVGEAQL